VTLHDDGSASISAGVAGGQCRSRVGGGLYHQVPTVYRHMPLRPHEARSDLGEFLNAEPPGTEVPASGTRGPLTVAAFAIINVKRQLRGVFS
jgi:hypothetical protein